MLIFVMSQNVSCILEHIRLLRSLDWNPVVTYNKQQAGFFFRIQIMDESKTNVSQSEATYGENGRVQVLVNGPGTYDVRG